LAETREPLVGYYLLNGNSLDEAIFLAVLAGTARRAVTTEYSGNTTQQRRGLCLSQLPS
jgi:hypothetical protein